MASFSERLKALRIEKGLTQDELAERLNISRSTMAGYEAPSKKRVPDPDGLIKLATFFDVSIDYLLGHTDNRRPYSPVPETMTLEDALRELLNSEHVMFNDLPVGELDDETKEDFLVIVRALLGRRARHQAQRASEATQSAKKAAAAAE